MPAGNAYVGQNGDLYVGKSTIMSSEIAWNRMSNIDRLKLQFEELRAKSFAFRVLLVTTVAIGINSCSNLTAPMVTAGTSNDAAASPPAAPMSSGASNQRNPTGCIPPVATIAYPANLAPSLPLPPESPIPPAGRWQLIDRLPSSIQQVQGVLVRSDTDVWLVASTGSGGLWKYRQASKEWTNYSSIQSVNVRMFGIFSSLDGHVWTIGYVVGESGSKQARMFFAEYDEASDQFEFSAVGDDLLSAYNVSSLRQGRDSTLWIMAQKKGSRFPTLLTEGQALTLFSVNLSSLETRQYREFPWPGHFAIGPAGEIWTVLDDSNGPFLEQYIPATDETHQYPALPPAIAQIGQVADVGFLYIDRSGHLWLDDRGWLDFTNPRMPTWNQVIRSPVFLTDRGEADTRYVWIRPTDMYQSGDGTYWFRSLYGLVRLDLRTGEWCKFTNGTGPIAEDKVGNVWVAVLGGLYKYPAVP